MSGARPNWRSLLANPRVAAALTLGFASGLPFNLPDSTLQAWLASPALNIDLRTIGWLTLVSMPYAFKFLWAPIVDRYAPPILGRRRGWIPLLQLAIAAGVAALGLQAPQEHIYAVAALALFVAFLSATQDIVIDAYRTDTLRPEERGVGSSATQIGYRAATWITGALALIASDFIGWRDTYLAMAALMALCVVFTASAPEPERDARPPPSLAAAVAEPMRDFLTRPGFWTFAALIVLYKFGDAFALKLVTVFLIKGLGFSALEVGAISKTTIIAATLTGTLIGGLALARLGLFRALLVFGVLQAVTNLFYAVLAAAGKSLPLMVIAIGFDNLAGGMGAAAFVALLMALCDTRFSAFQYALLSALASVARNFLGPVAAFLVEGIGWPSFFVVTFLTALPGLGLLIALRGRIAALDHVR